MRGRRGEVVKRTEGQNRGGEKNGRAEEALGQVAEKKLKICTNALLNRGYSFVKEKKRVKEYHVG